MTIAASYNFTSSLYQSWQRGSPAVHDGSSGNWVITGGTGAYAGLQGDGTWFADSSWCPGYTSWRPEKCGGPPATARLALGQAHCRRCSGEGGLTKRAPFPAWSAALVRQCGCARSGRQGPVVRTALQVKLLGPFSVSSGDESAGPWPRPVAKRLCGLVLVSAGRRVSRTAACEALFPRLGPYEAARGLSKALSMAHAALSTLGPMGRYSSWPTATTFGPTPLFL